MHQNTFGGRAPLGPDGGATALPQELLRSPDPLAAIRGLLLREGMEEREKREGMREGWEEREREGRDLGGIAPSPNSFL